MARRPFLPFLLLLTTVTAENRALPSVFRDGAKTSESSAKSLHQTGCAILDGLEFDTILAASDRKMVMRAKVIGSGTMVAVKVHVGKAASEDKTGVEEQFLHEQLVYAYLSDLTTGLPVNTMKSANPMVDGKVIDGRCNFYVKGSPPQGMNPAVGEQFIGMKIPQGYPGHYNATSQTIVTASQGTLTNIDYFPLKACTGRRPDFPNCYIEVLELPFGTFPLGKKNKTLKRAPMVRKAKAYIFQIIYALWHGFKTIGFQHWDLNERSLMTREWPVGKERICYLIRNKKKEESMRCVEKATLTWGNTVEASMKGEGTSMEVILSDFDGSTAGCGETCGDCGSCGDVARLPTQTRGSLHDRSALLLLWARIRPCGLNPNEEDFPNMDEIKGKLELDNDCTPGVDPRPSSNEERHWISTIWNMPTGIFPSAKAISKKDYDAYMAQFDLILQHSFFMQKGVEGLFDTFASSDLDVKRCESASTCILRGCLGGDDRCLNPTNFASGALA